MPEDVTDRRSCHKCQMTVTGKRKLSKCARCHSITYCSKKCQEDDWSRHIQFCIPVMVTEIPGKGKGLVASKDFKKGQIIFKETAAIVINGTSDIVPLQELKKQISKMSVEQKSKFYQLTQRGNFNPTQLASALREKCLQELDIFFGSCFGFDGKLTLFLSPAFLNHSCAPNVFIDGISDPVSEFTVIATKDISKGEEVTQCFTDGRWFQTSSERKTMLQTKFSLDCKCGVCAGSLPHQDGLISEISSKIVMFSRPLDLLNPMKTKERMTEVDRIIDLSKQLNIGGYTDMIKVYKQLVVISQMCRDPIHLKKAMDAFKELGGC